MNERAILAETATADGTRVVLFEDTWVAHVLDRETGHPELEPHLNVVIEAIGDPDHRESDPRPARERFYKHGVGPSVWLMVVVDFNREPARIVTALGYGHGQSPSGWTA